LRGKAEDLDFPDPFEDLGSPKEGHSFPEDTVGHVQELAEESKPD
jgi:hypothetical protein